MSSLRITRFTPADQEAVRALVLGGLRERWGRLDPSLNGDLDDIGRAYPDAVVRVARLDDRIVGTGILKVRSDAGELMRMSVAGDVRRLGIGRALVDEFVAIARQLGLSRLVLETTAEWVDAVTFYERCGFTITHDEIGRFGRDLYLALEL